MFFEKSYDPNDNDKMFFPKNIFIWIDLLQITKSIHFDDQNLSLIYKHKGNINQERLASVKPSISAQIIYHMQRMLSLNVIIAQSPAIFQLPSMTNQSNFLGFNF